MIVTIKKGCVNGGITVPGSKSHTIRAIVIATLGSGKSVISNPLNSDDCKSALQAAIQFGAHFEQRDNDWVITAPELGIQLPQDVVDVGNSGTTLFFMTAMASLIDGITIFTGDSSIRKRPAEPLLKAIRDLGGRAYTTHPQRECAPYIIQGPISAGTVNIPCTTSQYVSALLMVAPKCDGIMKIKIDHPQEKPYLELTADWLKRTGISFIYDRDSYHFFEIPGSQNYESFSRTIPADWSSAAFPVVAGLSEGSNITVNNIDFTDKQGDSRVISELLDMGANIEIQNKHQKLIVRGGNALRGKEINMIDIPDAVPIMSLVGALAEGTTILTNVSGARKKETDRVSVMTELLSKMGVDITCDQNTIRIIGGKQLQGTSVESYGDHRIAMTMTVAGLFAKGDTTIFDAECASVTFPGFYDLFSSLGAYIKIEEGDNKL